MPRKVNWTEVESSNEGGEYKRLTAGAYVCTITKAEDRKDRENVQLLVDIAEGEFEGYFSDSFYNGKDWAHNVILSYRTPKGLGMTKGRLEAIQACNPGFDPFAAWDGDRMDMFVGRKVGVVFRDEEYWSKKNNCFEVGNPKPDRLCTFEEMELEKNQHPNPKMLDDAGKRDALQRAGYGEGDIAMILMAPSQPPAQQQAPAGTYDGPLPF